MKIEDETGAFGKVRIDIKVTIHLQGHLLAGGKAEAVARGKIPDFEERLKYIVALLFRNHFTRIRYNKLVLVNATFFVIEPNMAVFRRILCGVIEKMQQNMVIIIKNGFITKERSFFI